MADGNDPNWGKFASVGLEIAAGVGLGVAVGYWIDRKFRTEPWGILIGAGVGLAAGMYLFIKEGMRANRD